MADRDRSHLIRMRFKLPAGCKDGEGVAIETVVLREIDTVDSKQAGLLSDANKTTQELEMMTISIVSVNEEHFSGSMDGWNMKAQEAVGRLFLRLNGIPKSEEEAMAASGEVLPA